MKHLLLPLLAWLALGALIGSAQSVPPLINYQGRLTDQAGAPLPAGLYGIQFRLWDSPLASGTNDLIWGQQYASLAVQSNGVFNVILGSPGGSAIPNATPAVNNLAYAFNGTNCFLGVTVISSNGVAIPAPGEILPRQQLLSVPFAIVASRAETANFATNAMLASSAVTAQLATNLAPGIVALTNLAPRATSNPAGVGDVAVGSTTSFNAGGPNEAISSSQITITTTGRPLLILLISGGANPCYLYAGNNGDLAVQRDDGVIIGHYSFSQTTGPIAVPGSLVFLDTPAPGTHSYWVYVATALGQLLYAKLVAFEL